jgi:hypothetical protein
MTKAAPPRYTAPLPRVLAGRAWHYLTWWPWQTRQLRQMGAVRIGWMHWQLAPTEMDEVLADLRHARTHLDPAQTYDPDAAREITQLTEGWDDHGQALPCGWPPASDPARYCRRCDLFIGFGAAGVAIPPPEHDTDITWLETHCWICRRTAEEITADA